MRKICLIVLMLLAFSSVAFAEDAESVDQGKVSVIVLPSRVIQTDANLMASLKQNIYSKFNPQKYSIQIIGNNPSPEFLEFLEEVRADNAHQQTALPIIKKEHYLKYGKDTGSSYVICISIVPADIKVVAGLFSASLKYNVQADIVAFDVKNDKYLWSKSFLTPKKGNAAEGLEWVLTTINQQFEIPDPLHR